MPEPVYLDSGVFITPVIYRQSPKVRAAASVLRKVEKEEISAYTSVLTWDEVVWVVRKSLGRADSIEVGKKLLSFPRLRFRDVGEEVVARSQHLVEKYEQLSPRDAIHCSSAIVNGLRTIVSDDHDFDIVEEIKREPLSRSTSS